MTHIQDLLLAREEDQHPALRELAVDLAHLFVRLFEVVHRLRALGEMGGHRVLTSLHLLVYLMYDGIIFCAN